MVFIIDILCSNFIFISLPTWIIFLGFLLLSHKPFNSFSLCVILFLLLHIPFGSFITTLVPLVTWWHFMLLDIWTSPSWSMIKGQPLFLNIVYALCLLFSQVIYIFLKIYCMIIITWFKFFILDSYDLFVRETMGGWLWSLLYYLW